MTEEEWKAFDKSTGTTVYVLDGVDYPQPWKIQSTYSVGATLYKGHGLEKRWISRHYRQILTEDQKAEYLVEYQKAHDPKTKKAEIERRREEQEQAGRNRKEGNG